MVVASQERTQWSCKFHEVFRGTTVRGGPSMDGDRRFVWPLCIMLRIRHTHYRWPMHPTQPVGQG